MGFASCRSWPGPANQSGIPHSRSWFSRDSQSSQLGGLEDIGLFCNHAGWPNVTCFVVNKATGECSYGMEKVTKEDAEVLREAAWLEYASRKTGPLVDVP